MPICENCNIPECDFGFSRDQCESCGQDDCNWGTFSFGSFKNEDAFDAHRARFDYARVGCTFGDFTMTFEQKNVKETIFRNIGFNKTQCEHCDEVDCTWGTFSFGAYNNMEEINAHRIRFNCVRFACTFGDCVSKFDEEEEKDSWWPTPFQSSLKRTIPLADILKNFCKCFLDLETMTVNKDECVVHGIHSDADEEEYYSDEDDGYYCW